MKKIILLALLVGLVGCGKTENKPSTSDSFEVRVNDATIKCSGASTETKEYYDVVRDLILLNRPESSSDKVINTKATEYSGEKSFRSIYIGDRVLETCTQNGYSFITTGSDPHILENSGWVKENVLKNRTGDKYEGRISSFVTDPHESGYYEGQIQKFINIKPSIQELEILAAKRAIDSGKCDFVESAMLDRFGNDVEQPMVDVICKNSEGFRLSKNEILGDSETITSNKDRAITKSEAIEECKKLIIPNLTNKGTADFDEIIGNSYNLNTKNGNVALTLDFSAKNSLGIEQSFKAKCIFGPDGQTEISIK